MLSTDPSGALCAFQLKGGEGSFGLAEFEQHQVQLHALATTAVRHPRFAKPTLPDRVFLVTNQVLTPPARDRLTVLSDGLRAKDYAAIEPIEQEQLLKWFVEAHGSFFPQEPERVSSFLGVFLEDGRGPLPKARLTEVVAGLLPRKKRARRTDCARAVTSAALLASYMLEPWYRTGNHVAVAEGWVLFCSQVLRLAERQALQEAHWETAYEIAMGEATSALERLLKEADAADDLLGDGAGETLVYGTKALLTLGYIAALVLIKSPRVGTGDSDAAECLEMARRVVERERPYVRVAGEAAAPHYFMIAYLLLRLGEFRAGEGMIMLWARLLAMQNAPGGENALPDPYHELGDILLAQVSPDTRQVLDEEQFDGSSYTLSLAIDWLARRLWRQFLNSLWPKATKITHCNYLPGSPEAFLALHDGSGVLRTSIFPSPTSWSRLRAAADEFAETDLPQPALNRPAFMLLYPLVVPHRFNARSERSWDRLLA